MSFPPGSRAFVLRRPKLVRGKVLVNLATAQAPFWAHIPEEEAMLNVLTAKLVEETLEALEAIAEGGPERITEELVDLFEAARFALQENGHPGVHFMQPRGVAPLTLERLHQEIEETTQMVKNNPFQERNAWIVPQSYKAISAIFTTLDELRRKSGPSINPLKLRHKASEKNNLKGPLTGWVLEALVLTEGHPYFAAFARQSVEVRPDILNPATALGAGDI